MMMIYTGCLVAFLWVIFFCSLLISSVNSFVNLSILFVHFSLKYFVQNVKLINIGSGHLIVISPTTNTYSVFVSFFHFQVIWSNSDPKEVDNVMPLQKLTIISTSRSSHWGSSYNWYCKSQYTSQQRIMWQQLQWYQWYW